jgi:FHS family Na+ dependent glucose MFS transporter 1
MIFGSVLAVLGTVLGLPEMHERLRLDAAQEGTLFLLLYVGVFFSNLAIGPLLQALGHKWVLLASAILVAASLLGFSGAHSFGVAIGAAMVLGFGGGAINTGVNTLVSQVYVDRRASMLNLLGVFHGAGALFIPLGTAALAAFATIPQLFLLAALFPLVCAVYYSFLKFPATQVSGRISLLDTLRAIRYPSVLLIGMLLFFEAGNEAVVSSWTSIYAGSIGLAPRAATLVLAWFWAMVIVGRALAAPLLMRVAKPKVILGGAILAVIGCGLLLSAKSFVTLSLGAAIIGLALGPIFQTALGAAGDRNQHSLGSVYGLLFAMAMVGGMSAPWAVGQISERYSLRYGPLLPLVGSVCVGVLAILLWRGERRSRMKNLPEPHEQPFTHVQG